MSMLKTVLVAVALSTLFVPTEANAQKTKSTVPATWKTYKNPMGVMMRYPDTWKLNDINGLLLLVPPGGQVNPNQASEMYNVVGMPVPGVAKASDPRLLQMADSMVAQMFPYMSRRSAGEVTRVAGTEGLIVTYEGNNPTTGQASRIRSYALVHKGMLLQIQAWGDRAKLEARDDVLRSMFQSITLGAGQNDPHLVGNWAGASTSNDRVRQDGGRLQSSVASQSASSYRLMADGSLLALTVSRTSVSINSSKDLPDSVDALVDSGDQQRWTKGRWYAGNGKIVVVMEDGTGMSADYKVMGSVLVVQFAGGATAQFTRQ